jgi:holliday junction DNA helicase RuvA
VIDRLQGHIVAKTNTSLTLMIGGVGLLVNVPRSASDKALGEEVHLLTHLVVREDSLTLYGFLEDSERLAFEALNKVNGVGPRLALAILSTLTVDHLREAVARENADILGRVPGIGKKTASKILLELKGKPGFNLGLDAVPVVGDVDTDVLDTLVALGYSVVEAQSAIQAIPPKSPQDLEERVRLALQYFA